MCFTAGLQAIFCRFAAILQHQHVQQWRINGLWVSSRDPFLRPASMDAIRSQQQVDTKPTWLLPAGSKAAMGASFWRASQTRTHPSLPPVTTSGGPCSPSCIAGQTLIACHVRSKGTTDHHCSAPSSALLNVRPAALWWWSGKQHHANSDKPMSRSVPHASMLADDAVVTLPPQQSAALMMPS